MRKLTGLAVVMTAAAVLAGCQNASSTSAVDQASFKPKPMSASDMSQKSAAIAERMKEYQRLHPPVGATTPASPASALQ